MIKFWIVLALAFVALPARAKTAALDWPAEKCATYAAAWTQALDMFGSDGLDDAFLAGNETFITSGCSAAGEICPRSAQELEIANALTLALMNAGAASTFLPFNCPRPEATGGGWSGPGL